MIRWRDLFRAWRTGRSAPALARPAGPAPAAGQACAKCLHFRNAPADMEAAVPGLASLSSGHASVRADDGLCLKHDRFVTAGSGCGAFRARLDPYGGLDPAA